MDFRRCATTLVLIQTKRRLDLTQFPMCDVKTIYSVVTAARWDWQTSENSFTWCLKLLSRCPPILIAKTHQFELEETDKWSLNAQHQQALSYQLVLLEKDTLSLEHLAKKKYQSLVLQLLRTWLLLLQENLRTVQPALFHRRQKDLNKAVTKRQQFLILVKPVLVEKKINIWIEI